MVKRLLAVGFVVFAFVVIHANERGPWSPIGKGPATSVIPPSGIPIPACTGDGSGNGSSVCPAAGADNTIVQNATSPNTFVFKSGYHRLQTIFPRTGDIFLAESGAILSGARVLTGWTSGNGTTCHSHTPCWFVDGQTQHGGSAEFPGDTNPTVSAGCAGNTGYRAGTNNPEGLGNTVQGYFNCFHPEDVTFDNVFKYHCWTFTLCSASNAHGNCIFTGAPDCGGWYLDYNGNGAFSGSPQYRLYVFDDPTSHKVEASITPYAFSNANQNVTVAGSGKGSSTLTGLLMFENYATPYDGAVLACNDGWLCDHLELRGNHYAGVDGHCNGVTQFVYTHHNGAFGVHGGCNAVFQDSEVSFNNYQASLDIFWGSGGSKWAFSDQLKVLRNYSHDNYGPGFWTDINNINVEYANNTINDNYRAGIFHEVSYSAHIHDNVLARNGLDFLFPGYPTESCIGISTSQNVEVDHNTCTDNWGGIAILQEDRSCDGIPPNHGAYISQNNYIHDNTVNSITNINGNGGCCMNGMLLNMMPCRPGSTVINSFPFNNLWAANHYHFSPSRSQYFQWSGGGTGNDAGWQASTTISGGITKNQDVGATFQRP